MSAWRGRTAARRVEAWLWTGPLGHLAGGALDLGQALLRHGVTRAWRAWRPPDRERRQRFGRR